MDNFDLKKYLAEGRLYKPTLNEGQFSWITQDSKEQIGSEPENTIDVYMIDNKGNVYYEDKYEGYGEFGGKDYYELLDQMNGGEGDRSRGISLAYGEIDTESPVLFPALVTDPKFVGPNYDFTEEADRDPHQGWHQEEEEYEDSWDAFGYDDEDEDEDIYENELKESTNGLSKEEYTELYPVIGREGLGYQFNYSPKLGGAYIVPRDGEDAFSIAQEIEGEIGAEYEVEPFQYQHQQFVSGTRAGSVPTGTESTWLRIVKVY